MKRDEIERKVKKIVVEQLGIQADKVTLESAITSGGTDPSVDLNADSLNLVELTMSLEEVFEIEILDDDVVGLKTVKDLIDYVELHT